jgi:hypothetical protein
VVLRAHGVARDLRAGDFERGEFAGERGSGGEGDGLEDGSAGGHGFFLDGCTSIAAEPVAEQEPVKELSYSGMIFSRRRRSNRSKKDARVSW